MPAPTLGCSLKIAHIAPLYYSVPPRRYGGTERLIAYLVEEQVKQGHQVALFASGDSRTSARLIAPIPRALADCRRPIDPTAAHLLLLDHVAERAADFNVLHFHVDALHFPLVRGLRTPSVTTLYWHQEVPEQDALYRRFKDLSFVALSEHQRKPRPWLNWRATVYHGLPPSAFPFRRCHGTYLAFVGRITAEKGVAEAVQIARRSGLPLAIAGPVADEDYFKRAVGPYLDDGRVHYVGTLSERAKRTFLSDAWALLFPSDCSEAYGVVVVEALACGTPVITYAQGPMPEIVQDGVTGYLTESPCDAVRAVRAISSLKREDCRRDFERRFDVQHTAIQYFAVYSDVIA